MAKIFPYLTERQIRYALGKLIKRGILKTGNYSDGECNRTTWYAFGENYVRPNLQNCQMQVTKLSDASDKNVSSYSNTYNNIIIPNTDKSNTDKESVPDGTARKKFVKPTVEEVAAYISEKGYPVNATSFVAYYDSNGWKVGRNPMKDWKAAVRSWAAREKERQNPSQSDGWDYINAVARGETT